METMRTAAARRPGDAPGIAERMVFEREKRPCLLLIEDDDAVRRALQLLLQGQGYDVHSFASGRAALADVAPDEARYLVADYMLADGDGINLLATLRNKGWAGLAVMITAFSSPDVVAAATKAGFAAVLDKPFRDDDLLRALRY